METPPKTEQALLGGGCFWCVEAVFEQVPGVQAVTSGYAGGAQPQPTYRQVCTGTTGHAEVVNIEYDPAKVSFERILEVFFHTHDPTTLNRQGADQGTQYRSVIFYRSPEQKKAAETCIRKLTESQAFAAPIVTALVPFTEFFPAEDYHQDYFRRNPEQAYCAAVIRPKLEKFRKMEPRP